MFPRACVAQNKLRLTLCVQGMWAEKELPRMAAPEIAEFEAVLDQENPDMFKWLTGQVRKGCWGQAKLSLGRCWAR